MQSSYGTISIKRGKIEKRLTALKWKEESAEQKHRGQRSHTMGENTMLVYQLEASWCSHEGKFPVMTLRGSGKGKTSGRSVD